MRAKATGVIWGIVLIVLGIFFLLENLNKVHFGDIFWGVVMGVGGILFLSWFVQAKAHWWALIPGVILLSLAGVSLLNYFAPHVSETWSGGIILGGIGLSFLLVYLSATMNWWALIPAGVMFTLAVVSTLDELSIGIDTGGIFFIGLGLTFGVLAVAPTPAGAMRWAWIPALALLTFGVLLLVSAEQLLEYFWPVALIVWGVYLLWRVLRSARKEG